MKTLVSVALNVRVLTFESPECSSALVVPPFSKFLPVKFWWLYRSDSRCALVKFESVLSSRTSWFCPRV